uniref:Uncharacterized protein n=1 Tax=Meloidogyne floridensis TaxID=298350 RepID=A0A915P6U6_9BILA
LDDVLIEIQGKLYSPQQITSFILIKLKEMTENYLNKKVGDAIITVPNYFDYSQKQALKLAGELAGMKILRFVPDSVAAAFGYGLDRYWRGAVCNLNGGSFEFSVLKLRYFDYEIDSNKYDTCLSGEAFNNVIVNYFVYEFKRENGIDLNMDSIAKQRLREAAEKAKCELSNSTQTEIILPNIIADTNGELKHFQIILTRSKFEQLTLNLTQRFVEICQQTKEKIKPEVEQPSLDNEIVSQNREEDLPSAGFDRVLLVGGMTRIPMIRNIVEEVFKKKIFNSQLEEGALAIGAVYLGVFLGDINYFDNKRTSKIEIIKMASQKMFIGERNRDEEDAAKLFWEAIAIYVKEYYSSLHIDIRSRNAIKGLGYFALRHTDRGIPHGHSAIYLSDDIPKRGACWVFEGEHERLCKAAFNFFKNFLFINKKKVWSKLKPYVLGKKLVTEEKEDLINKDFQKLKFKRISTRKRNAN